MSVPYYCNCTHCANLVHPLCASPPRTRGRTPCARTACAQGLVRPCVHPCAYLVHTLCAPCAYQPCARPVAGTRGSNLVRGPLGRHKVGHKADKKTNCHIQFWTKNPIFRSKMSNSSIQRPRIRKRHLSTIYALIR